MKPVFLINDAVLFEPDKRQLCPLAGYPERAVILHGPVSECLLQLLEHNGEVITQRSLFAAVWEKQGAIVTTNALYQTIASMRKALKAAGLEDNIVQTVPKEGFKSVARIQVGELDAFMAVAAPAELPPRHNTSLRLKMAYAAAGALFIASCSVLYLQLNERQAGFESFQPVGNINGCNVYSSWHDKSKNEQIFTALAKRYPVKCSTGAEVYMTLNRFQVGTSLMVCDRRPDIKGAQCDSILYREQYHENE